MGTSQAEIRGWLLEGKKKNATHMIVVCDTYDHEDFPVYVLPGQDARKEYESLHGKNMQRVMEVYNLSKDIEPQLSTYRAMEF